MFGGKGKKSNSSASQNADDFKGEIKSKSETNEKQSQESKSLGAKNEVYDRGQSYKGRKIIGRNEGCSLSHPNSNKQSRLYDTYSNVHEPSDICQTRTANKLDVFNEIDVDIMKNVDYLGRYSQLYEREECENLFDLKTHRKDGNKYKKPEDDTEFTMSLCYMDNLISKEPNEILLTLISPNSGFLKIIAKVETLPRNLMARLLIALGKSCQSTLHPCLIELFIAITRNKHFVAYQLQMYIATFQFGVNEHIHWESLQCLIEFLKQFKESEPTSNSDILAILIPALKSALHFKLQDNSSLCCRLLAELDELDNKSNKFINNHSEMRRKVPSFEENLQLQRPPEDYFTLGNINALTLKCQNCNRVSSDKEFKLLPNGSCKDMNFKCKKKCGKRLCVRNHVCEKPCCQECDPCYTEVMKVIPFCHHRITMPCSVYPQPNMCTAMCSKYLKCGHPCTENCNARCTISCKQKVTVNSLCGHEVTVDCYKRTLPDEVMALCNNPCQTLLDCGHMCTGTCAECFQGRLHVRCQSECKRTLVCGHVCKEPCASNCPPCQEKCDNCCVHRRCPRICGAPCDPCYEKCQWKCQHKRCTKLCGEICDRDPCDVACDKELPCGHKCIGFCGEPCPKKCSICDAEELQEIFFGWEEDEGAKFIQLEDCKHVFEAKGFTQFMQKEPNKEGEIVMKSCPICKTVIRNNFRFGNSIKSTLSDIEQVKRVIFGGKEGNERKKNQLLQNFRELQGKYWILPLYRPLCKWIENGMSSRQDILRAESISTIVIELESVLSHFLPIINVISGNITVDLNLDLYVICEPIGYRDGLINCVKATTNLIIGFIYKEHRKGVSNQQLQEVACEAQRLSLMFTLLSICNEFSCKSPLSNRHEAYCEAVDCITDTLPFTTEKRNLFLESLNILKLRCGYAKLNISDTERLFILGAMNLPQGHWFQCPNGHVYCITECGGAMEVGKCNECGAAIGGQSHALRDDNRVATAMDGAVHGAWTEAANMANYRF